MIIQFTCMHLVDTPLKESRFSQYFEGWVDENRDDHDDHHIVAHEIEEHDIHDQPFEEVNLYYCIENIFIQLSISG